MLNKEKFAKEILDIACTGAPIALNKETNKLTACDKINCDACAFSSSGRKCSDKTIEWCNSEYIELEVDWNRVPVDTPVFVKNREESGEESIWYKRYFAYYENGEFYCFANGTTLWSSDKCMIPWKYAKLANEEDIKKYVRID